MIYESFSRTLSRDDDTIIAVAGEGDDRVAVDEPGGVEDGEAVPGR